MTRKFETLITRQEYLRFLETPAGQGIPKPDWWRPPPLEDLPPAPIPPAPVTPSKPALSKAEVIRLLSDPIHLSRDAFLKEGGKDGQFRKYAPKLENEGKRTPLRPGPRPKVPE